MGSDTGLTNEQLRDLANRLQGTQAASASDLAEEMFSVLVDESGLEGDLADFAEYCQGCGLWCETSEMICEHDVIGYCEACRIGGECPKCKAERYDEEAEDGE